MTVFFFTFLHEKLSASAHSATSVPISRSFRSARFGFGSQCGKSKRGCGYLEDHRNISDLVLEHQAILVNFHQLHLYQILKSANGVENRAAQQSEKVNLARTFGHRSEFVATLDHHPQQALAKLRKLQSSLLQCFLVPALGLSRLPLLFLCSLFSWLYYLVGLRWSNSMTIPVDRGGSHNQRRLSTRLLQVCFSEVALYWRSIYHLLHYTFPERQKASLLFSFGRLLSGEHEIAVRHPMNQMTTPWARDGCLCLKRKVWPDQ